MLLVMATYRDIENWNVLFSRPLALLGTPSSISSESKLSLEFVFFQSCESICLRDDNEIGRRTAKRVTLEASSPTFLKLNIV